MPPWHEKQQGGGPRSRRLTNTYKQEGTNASSDVVAAEGRVVEATTEVAIEGEGATHRGQPVGANHRRGPQLRCSRSRYTMAVEMAVDTHAQSSSSQDRARITLRSRRRLRCGRGVRGEGAKGAKGEGAWEGEAHRGGGRRAASVEPSYLRGGGAHRCEHLPSSRPSSDAIRRNQTRRGRRR